jgi:ABC-type dipeptide/oligopeptide/nickel transport system ATPase component
VRPFAVHPVSRNNDTQPHTHTHCNHVYYCDHLDVHAAAATIKAFAGDSVECHVKRNVVVARPNQPVEANLLDDLRGENCVLTPASPVQLGREMTEVDLQSVMDRLGVAAPFVWVEGQVAWARTAADAVAIKQALDDYRGECDHAEHYAVFASDKIDQPLPPEAPVKALEALFRSKEASKYGFLGRVTMEQRDGTVEFWGQFKSADGANNFVAQLRSGGALTRVRFDVVGVVAFQTAKIRVETRRIDAVDDATAGIRDGEMWPIDERITGDCVMIVGSTQSGKSTTVASAIGRPMKLVKDAAGNIIIKSENPFAAAKFAEEYAIIRRIRADAPRLHPDTIVPAGPEHADIVLPPDHFLARANVRGEYLPDGYEIVEPKVEWFHDSLVVVGDMKLLDSPGTDDTSGLRTDTRNAVIRKRVADHCEDSLRMCITIDFNTIVTAAALLGHITPLVSMLVDFEANVEKITLLFPKFSQACDMKEDLTADEYMTELKDWTNQAIDKLQSIVLNASSAVMQDRTAACLLKYALRELQQTQKFLNSPSTNHIGRATVVHPFAPAQRYLLPAIRAAVPIPGCELRASLGPKGSAALGRSFDIELAKFRAALREVEAVTIAAHAINALHRLETAATPVHFTKDARVDEVFNEMATEMAALYGYRVTTLEKAVEAGDVKAVQAAVSELEAGDSALFHGVRDVSPAVAAKVLALLAPNRPTAAATTARIFIAARSSSGTSSNQAAMWSSTEWPGATKWPRVPAAAHQQEEVPGVLPWPISAEWPGMTAGVQLQEAEVLVAPPLSWCEWPEVTEHPPNETA